jgi:predicted MFS family arabinose efflux permease
VTAETQNRQAAGEDGFTGLLSSRSFLCLMGAVFLAYANISVFFGFHDYLRHLPIDPSEHGLLIGALAATALLVRPLLSPVVHRDNARGLLTAGTLLAAGSLAAYSLAAGFWAMLTVRMLHGLSFALVGTALMALLVEIIPQGRSAQFFGYLAVITLIPNTLVPPLLPALETLTGGYSRILLLFAALTLCILPLIAFAAPPLADHADRQRPTPLTGRQIAEDLTDPRVLALLAAMLLLYGGHALVFFFLDGFGRSLGLTCAGLFMTMSTVGEIGIRVAAGQHFDRLAKTRLAIASLLALALLYILLPFAAGPLTFVALGLFFGLGWGVAMPVCNGLMFDISRPEFRAFNINLGLQMFQAGFFLGPIVGAPLIAGRGYPALFFAAAGISVAAAALLLLPGRPTIRSARQGG